MYDIEKEKSILRNKIAEGERTIAAIVAENTAARAELDRLERSVACPVCGKPVESDADFCTWCGAPMKPPAVEEPAPDPGPRCPNCGGPVKPDASFCMLCGTRLTEASADEAPEPASEPVGTPSEEQDEISSPFFQTPTIDGMPGVEPPVVEAPAVEPPVVEAPVVETPVVEPPVVEAPVVEPPVVETPVVEIPVVEPPIVEAPVVEAPVVDSPATDIPVPDTFNSNPFTEAAPPAPDPTLAISTGDGADHPENVCPKCGAAVKEGVLFCTECGTLLSEENEQKTEQVRYCTQCGAKISAETLYCTQCGARQYFTLKTK